MTTIAIIGTYGIPNRHGGFERFAEEISPRLAAKGHRVRVYQPSVHPFREKEWKGVELVRRTFPRMAGTAAPLFFDLFSLKHALRSDAEMVLQCGYTSSCWLPLLPGRKGKIIFTHMDGMEWQRTKWGWLTRRFIRWTETLAVKYSDKLIADHPELVKYYRDTYGKNASYISYGTSGISPTHQLSVSPTPKTPYILILSRLEPENHLEMMIQGFLRSGFPGRLLIVGDTAGRYADKLASKFHGQENIRFLGSIYEPGQLYHLRTGCTWYLHGHSAGGTNPSLIEAMAAGCTVLAHDNPYNRGVMESWGQYFRTADELAELLSAEPDRSRVEDQMKRFSEQYSWEKVAMGLEEMLVRAGKKK